MEILSATGHSRQCLELVAQRIGGDILHDSQVRQAGNVFEVEAMFHSFERFFNSPALMVQISKTACGESRHVEQALLQINRLKHAPDKMIHWPVCIETRQHCSTIGSA